MTLLALATLAFSPTPPCQLTEVRPFLETLPAPVEALTMDVDGDGDPDAVVVDRAGNRMKWFETLPGGEVAPGRVISEQAPRLRDPVAVDLDLDGDLDIVASRDFVPCWFENTGGAFASFQPLTAPLARPAEIEVADMDGDGVHDLVLRLDRDEGIRFCRGLGGASFAAPVQITTLAEEIRGSHIADMDGDGDLDLVYTAWPSSQVVVLRNDGAWPLATQVIAGQTARPLDSAIDVGDVDLDGHVDIVCGASDGVDATDEKEYVFYGQGSLQFGAAVELDGRDAARAQVLADLDGDGDLDLVSAIRFAEFLWRENQGGSFSNGVRITGTYNGHVAMEPADFDQDGDADLLVCATSQNARGRSGGHIVEPSQPGSPFAGFLPLVEEIWPDTRLAIADFDGDGDMDHVAARYSDVFLLKNDGRGGVEVETLPPATPLLGGGTISIGPSAGDFNGDGVADIALFSPNGGPSVALGTGGGSFGPWLDLLPLAPRIYRDMASPVDVDGDGLDDLVLSGREQGTLDPRLYWIRSLPGGAFAPPVILLDGPAQVFRPIAADLNGDGITDLLTRRSSAGGELGHRVGLGNLAFGPIQDVPLSADLEHVVVEDLDGDGDLDIVGTTIFGGQEIRVYEMEAGAYQFPARIPHPDLLDPPVALDDDGDGDAEIFATPSVRTSLIRIEQTGPMTFGTPAELPLTLPYNAALWSVDHDLDGDEDLLWSAVIEKTTGLVINSSNGPIGSGYCDAIPNSTGSVGTLSAAGRDVAAADTIVLAANDLPSEVFCMAIASLTPDSVTGLASSIGRLCVGGSIIRLNGPGQIRSSGPSGQVFVQVELQDLPGGVAAGQTWHFQAWHRDVQGGMPTSNFTTATAIQFQ